MDRAEQIERLKQNKEAFGLMDVELQGLAKKIGALQFKFWKDGRFMQKQSGNFDGNFTYQLRPDYTEEPEEIVCEVRPDKALRHLFIEYCGVLVELTSAVAFIPAKGFRFDRAVFKTDNDVFCSYTGVTARVGDKTVHAVQVVYRKAVAKY